ncbi:hypothetical protein [Streptomyces sp. NPDC085540]|uniref:hypothetical protein n=1 Tax=Streptomyces sp. NPDC085540 TaxID=3365730 RepID=UPI0037D4A228
MHYTYRLSKSDVLPETMVELAACAVDPADVVLLCGTIYVHQYPETPLEEGDSWIGAGSEVNLSGTARVVLLPDQLRDDGRAHDPKDHDGYTPPRLPAPGDRLRTG